MILLYFAWLKWFKKGLYHPEKQHQKFEPRNRRGNNVLPRIKAPWEIWEREGKFKHRAVPT